MADIIAGFKKLSLVQASSADASLFPELTNEQKALASQYKTLSSRFDEPESLTSLNNNLRSKTFIVGEIPSDADTAVFVKVLPIAAKWTSKQDIAQFRHILRWADLVQNTLVEVPEADKLKVDYTAEVEKEVKEKKKPAATTAAAASGADAQKPTEKPAEKGAKPQGGDQRKELTEEEKKAKADAAKAKKAAKAEAQKAKQAAAAASAAPITPALIDFRVGFIQKAVRHPNADSLYMSTIDMGDEEGPRTVCSGLVKYVPIEDMQERYVVVIANLKPVTMRGVKSCAMVLCASNEEVVEFVNPPAGSKPGDKLFFEGYNGTPEKQLNPKKKIWETIQPGFTTTDTFEVTWTAEGKPPAKLVNEKGELCRNTTVASAKVS